ncbi:MAG: serine/threonine protein kinase [Planctomycetes bacterium]|nr:serine/threonine protein kinase [Planctomycetota bacterium]
MKPHLETAALKDCPGPEKLTGYNLGTLPLEEIALVAAHLEECRSCLETLQRLDDRSDPLVFELGGQNFKPGGTADEVRLTERLKELLPWPAMRLSVASKPPTPPGTPPPRQVGPYELLEPLGEGGMGAVYRARHLHLGKIMALKLLPAAHLSDPVAVTRFMQEMKAVGQLSHPNIVQAHDAGVEGIPYLAMELLEGMDLSRLVKECGPLRVADASECIRQAALALQHAHERGLVHRDVKPSNLMLTPEGCVKLLDLGLARLDTERAPPADELAAPAPVVGTIDYIAPEQLQDSRTVDIRADLYSLGGALYYLLTGQPPFGTSAQGNLAKQRARLEEAAPDVRVLRSSVPEALVIVLERLLARDPAYRFTTPAELCAAITPLTAGCNLRALFPRGGPVSARSLPSALRSPFDKPTSLSPWQVGALVFLAVLVALGLLALWPGLSHDREGPPDVSQDNREQPLIVALDVGHYRSGEQGLVSLGLIGREHTAVPSRGDSFRVTARLRESASCYLIAFRPDGKDVLCFPNSELEPPEPREGLVYPPQEFLPVMDSGVYTFALVASTHPLPEYQRWRAGQGIWPRQPLAGEGTWRFDGQQYVQLSGGLPPLAGKPEVPAFLKALCQSLSARPQVDALQVIAFSIH